MTWGAASAATRSTGASGAPGPASAAGLIRGAPLNRETGLQGAASVGTRSLDASAATRSGRYCFRRPAQWSTVSAPQLSPRSGRLPGRCTSCARATVTKARKASGFGPRSSWTGRRSTFATSSSKTQSARVSLSPLSRGVPPGRALLLAQWGWMSTWGASTASGQSQVVSRTHPRRSLSLRSVSTDASGSERPGAAHNTSTAPARIRQMQKIA